MNPKALEPGRLGQALERGRLGERLRAGPEHDRGAGLLREWAARSGQQRDPKDRDSAAYIGVRAMNRNVVKFTFLKVDPAWRRLPAAEREKHKREFEAACDNFAADRFLRAYSLVGTRGDADLMLWTAAPGLADIHEFHVVLGQSGLMAWADTPYSYLAMTKESEYSEEDRLEVRAGKHKYLFVYPFEKKREWYRLPAEERMRIMREHIEIGRRYPQISINTTYSFGLDDQEFVVSFECDEPGDFLDLVHELRPSESSAYTLRDTPIFTCIASSVRHALDALDGEAPTTATSTDGNGLASGQSPRSSLINRDLHSDQELRVAIVGAGPAGFYAAGHLLAADRPRPRRPVRPPADAVRARARRRRAGPPEDQVGRARLREDGGEGGLPLLRRRRARARPASRRPARALPRGDLRDRRGDRPAARDPRRGPAGLRGRHDLRRLVQRPP